VAFEVKWVVAGKELWILIPSYSFCPWLPVIDMLKIRNVPNIFTGYIFMTSMAISCQRCSVFWLSNLHLWMCVIINRKFYEYNILQTARRSFTKFTSWVQLWTKMNWLDFEFKRSKVKVMTRACMVKNHLFKMHLSGEDTLVHICRQRPSSLHVTTRVVP